jgi:hypothetical protein
MSNSIGLSVAAVVLLSNLPAFAVKSLQLDILKTQAIVVEVPPNQWAMKETSWTGGIPIAVLRVDAEFICPRRLPHRKGAGVWHRCKDRSNSRVPCELEAD